MNRLVLLIFLILHTTFIHSQSIILLYGSGSAGKSTLARELVNLNQDWCYIDEDEVFNQIWLEYVSNRFPKEYRLIAEALPPENLFQAIKNSTIIFPEDSVLSKKESVQEAIETIQNIITENNPSDFRRAVFECFEMSISKLIHESSRQNKSVILDRWYTTPEMLHKTFPDISVHKVLVFSTLQNTLNNFIQRNQRAERTRNSSSHRLYKNFIPSYIRLYKLSEDPSNSLYCYQHSDIDSFFENVRSNLSIDRTESQKDFLFKDLTKEKLDELKKEFIPEKFCGNKLFLSPIGRYDFIINMQDINSKKKAHQFLKYSDQGFLY